MHGCFGAAATRSRKRRARMVSRQKWRSEALRFEGHVSLIATGRRQPGWLAADQLLLKSFPIIIVHLFKESSFFISCSSLDIKRSEQISWIS
jgi:hypothetical protein